MYAARHKLVWDITIDPMMTKLKRSKISDNEKAVKTWNLIKVTNSRICCMHSENNAVYHNTQLSTKVPIHLAGKHYCVI